MRKLFSFLLIIVLCLSLTACAEEKVTAQNKPGGGITFGGSAKEESTAESTPEENPAPEKEENHLLGRWETISGEDSHQIEFSAENALTLYDGDDAISATYETSGGAIVITGSEDLSCFSFKLIGNTLIRYEDGEADGYTYQKIA